MKILLVSSKYHPEYSGSGYRAHKTYKRLEKKYGISFDIISNSRIFTSNLFYEFDSKKIYRISAPIKYFGEIKFLKYLSIVISFFWENYFAWNFIRKHHKKYDLLHTFGNTFTIGFLTWYFSKKNKPVIRELCNEMLNPFFPIQFERIFKKVFSREKSLVVAISNKLEKVALSHGIKNIWSRPNPIEEKSFKIEYKNKFILRQKITKFNKHHIVISCIANFTDNKNQIFLIDVFKNLPDEYRMILAGPLRNENKVYFKLLKDKIKKLGLEDKIYLKSGFIENIDQYIKLSDVFLVPSKSEGMCTPILEAQSCGVPVISNFIENVTDQYILTGEGGFCIKLDKKKWVRAILEVVKINKSILQMNSKKIQKIASSKIIDDLYYKKISSLIKL
tara:strand:+ start:652 stop:1821 length:1170 start_codon:yes stop_codon:yes gene_type:complete